MNRIIEALDLKLIRKLEGKTKSVYLVSRGKNRYILKLGTNDIESVLLTKEIEVNKVLKAFDKITPLLAEQGSIQGTFYMLQEFYSCVSLDKIKNIDELKDVYTLLADCLLEMQKVQRAECGGFGTEKKFKTWKSYLQHKLKLYQNSINSKNNIVHSEVFSKLGQSLLEIKEPRFFSFLHMDLHEGNIFIENHSRIRLIDFDEAIFGDKDYEIARMLKSHFVYNDTKSLLKPFLSKVGLENYLKSNKAKVYSDMRIIHYIEILCREGNGQEAIEQLNNLSFEVSTN